MQDKEKLYPMSCSHCEICKEFSHVFSKLKDAYFFTPKTEAIYKTDIPFQPVLWRFFSAKTKIHIQIAKSKKSIGIIIDYGEVC